MIRCIAGNTFFSSCNQKTCHGKTAALNFIRDAFVGKAEMAADLLSIGEESGRVGQVCGRIADHYEKELRIRVKRIIALIEPVFILLIAVIAGYIVMSMLSVILSINEIAG